MERGVEIFGFADLVNFWFGFSIFAVFRFWCLGRFAGFLQFSFWFSVFVNNDNNDNKRQVI